MNDLAVRQKAKVAVVMGSKSDLEVMKACVKVLADFKVPHEVRVISAHRTPDKLRAEVEADDEEVRRASSG
jgi:5-(carboxyamino)imidazole ribonucleotide mutase